MRIHQSPILFSVLAQCLLAGSVVAMGVFVGLPWITTGAVVLLYALTTSLVRQRRGAQWELALGWVCTLVAWGGMLLGEGEILTLDIYYAVIILLTSGGIILAGRQLESGPLKTRWFVLAFTWAFLAGFLWLVVAYQENLKFEFYTGLGIFFALLLAAKFAFRLPGFAIQIVNTMLLLLIGVPVANAFLQPDYRLNHDARAGEQFYSYEFAKRNPTAFAHWWNHFVEEWRDVQKQICTPDPLGRAPFLFRPGTDGQMFQSRVHINQLGFRGPEIAKAKGQAYRIVALGESTTFGHTLNADDVPWPRLLEKMIRDEFNPTRPVQVINAGIPSYTVRLNDARLAAQILPLKPDMIISYHGYNGFRWLDPALPPRNGPGPPPYVERPLKLLADCEYRLKLMAYRHRRLTALGSTNRVPADPMKTEYARAYEELFQAARTNHIQLVLANYSMAVNAESDAEVVNFYRSAFPRVLAEIRANEVHSRIIDELAKKHPGICRVDTRPGLDGEHTNFIDLVHFTQKGREQLASTIFDAIKPLLPISTRKTPAASIP